MNTEDDKKIRFADNLRFLINENCATHQTLAHMLGYIDDIVVDFDYTSEPKILKRYLLEMARCSALFKNQLKGASALFDLFILNVKRNAPIEHVFCYSEDEQKLSSDAESESENETTKGPGEVTDVLENSKGLSQTDEDSQPAFIEESEHARRGKRKSEIRAKKIVKKSRKVGAFDNN